MMPNKLKIRQYLNTLVGERNPYSSAKQLHQIADYIEKHFISCGLKTIREEVPFDGQIFHNVYGYLQGIDSTKGTFIIGAHFDSVEGTPGADDNASAVAALMEIARCIGNKNSNMTILFAGFNLEEYGFVGSRLMAERLHKDKESILGMISLEMLGYRVHESGSQKFPPYVDPSQYPDKGDFIAVVGNEPSQNLTYKIVEAMRSQVPNLPVEYLVLPGTGEKFIDVRLSDHSPFWENGFNAVMITDTAFFRNPHYHQSSDTLDTLDLDFIRDISEGIVAFLLNPKF